MDWTYLITAVLSGSGITAFIQWLFNRRLHTAKSKRDEESVWREMYESNNQAILNLNEENRKLREAFARMERMVYKTLACRFYDTCPIRFELQKYHQDTENRTARGTPVQRKADRYARDDPYSEGTVDNPDERPP